MVVDHFKGRKRMQRSEPQLNLVVVIRFRTPDEQRSDRPVSCESTPQQYMRTLVQGCTGVQEYKYRKEIQERNGKVLTFVGTSSPIPGSRNYRGFPYDLLGNCEQIFHCQYRYCIKKYSGKVASGSRTIGRLLHGLNAIEGPMYG